MICLNCHGTGKRLPSCMSGRAAAAHHAATRRERPLPHKVPGAHCPNCGKWVDGATGVSEGARPKPGDISICIKLDPRWSAYAEDLTLLTWDDEEMIQIAGSTSTYWQRCGLSNIAASGHAKPRRTTA